LRKAETIVNNAQNAKEKGWRPFEGGNNKNRYWLIQNLLDDKYRPGKRNFFYKYHRQGLDRMAEKNLTKAVTKLPQDLKLLQQVYRASRHPYMYLLQVIFDTKSDEW